MAKIPPIKDGDWGSVRRAIQKLDKKLGPDGSPIFASLDVIGAITAYDGRDVVRYALMMGLITRKTN